MAIVFHWLSGGIFLTPENLYNIAQQSAVVGIVAAAMAIRVTTPLRRLTEASRALAEGELGRRIPGADLRAGSSELAALAEREGATVLVGSCDRLGLTYLPLRMALRPVLVDRPAEHAGGAPAGVRHRVYFPTFHPRCPGLRSGRSRTLATGGSSSLPGSTRRRSRDYMAWGQRRSRNSGMPWLRTVYRSLMGSKQIS